MPYTNENRLWTDNTDWDETKIRSECIIGTKREWNAYINAGHIKIIAPVIPSYSETKVLNDVEGAVIPTPNFNENTTCHDVAVYIAQKHKTSVRALRAKGRNPYLDRARKEFAMICVHTLHKKCSIVGKYLNRDRTTVRYMAFGRAN